MEKDIKDKTYETIYNEIVKTLKLKPLPLTLLRNEVKNKIPLEHQNKHTKFIFKEGNLHKFQENYINGFNIFCVPNSKENRELLLKDFGGEWKKGKDNFYYNTYCILWESCKKNKKIWEQKRKDYLNKRFPPITIICGNLKKRNAIQHLLFDDFVYRIVTMDNEKRLRKLRLAKEVNFREKEIGGKKKFFIFAKVDGRWIGEELFYKYNENKLLLISLTKPIN